MCAITIHHYFTGVCEQHFKGGYIKMGEELRSTSIGEVEGVADENKAAVTSSEEQSPMDTTDLVQMKLDLNFGPLESLLTTVLDSVRNLEARVLPPDPLLGGDEHEVTFFNQSSEEIAAFMKEHREAVRFSADPCRLRPIALFLL